MLGPLIEKCLISLRLLKLLAINVPHITVDQISYLGLDLLLLRVESQLCLVRFPLLLREGVESTVLDP